MTIEQMWQKGCEARREAKALQWKMQTITDPEERKQLARQMNDLFALAKSLRDEAKHRHSLEESIEREFLAMNADLEDD
jgi:predicted  nucleic acid-binding Zn-ribbon protein